MRKSGKHSAYRRVDAPKPRTGGLMRLVPGGTRIRRGWLQLRPIVGERLLPVAMLGGTSVVAGLVEASVLTLLASIASQMVVHTRGRAVELGLVHLRMTIGVAIAVTLVLASVRLVLQLIVAWLPARIAADVQAELRHELFDAFTRASWPVKSDELEGHFQELMTNQIGQATGAVMNLAQAISAGAMFLALVVSAFSLSVVVAGLVLASAILMYGGFRPLDRHGRKAAAESSQASINQAGGVSEAVRLAEESQVFGVAAEFRARMGDLVETARTAFFRFALTGRIMASLYQSIVYLIIVGGLGGLYLAHAGNLAALGAVVLILVRASSYGQQLQGANHAIIQVLPYLERLYGSMDRYRTFAQVESGEPLPTVSTLAFDRIGYSYRQGSVVLHDVSFEVRAGETIGIIGPTGAGKSTVSQLLLRLREPETGTYVINGSPIGTFSRADWQRRVTYVSQEPRLHRGSVAENIRFFRDIDQAAIEHAARLAHVHDTITAMRSGYDTIIGQQADAVSGGQRQRICLARALAGHPEILLLDEPTSALDLESEAAVEASLAGLHGKMTIFIIAHRLSILRVCDKVLVLENGTVSAFAPTSELARSDKFYQRVAALAGRTS